MRGTGPLIEELTLVSMEESCLRLISACRSSMPGLLPQVFATTNPDGPDHTWVKKRWKIEGTPLRRRDA